ncbi:MAG: hypothetical protein HY316_09740 [Acidobacteria bacterium]|nr:hypothetical protein [Acidobacteriota bacterium]
MTTALPFTELLERAGARPGRYGRKWHCPRCPERTAPALAVDRDREVFYCHRCQWRGGRRALESELGIEAQKPTPAERRKARLIHTEAERFLAWERRRRIAAAALLRTLDRADADWREVGRTELASGEPVSERVWARLELCWRWQERAEARYRRLCEFESNARELYMEYMGREKAA